MDVGGKSVQRQQRVLYLTAEVVIPWRVSFKRTTTSATYELVVMNPANQRSVIG